MKLRYIMILSIIIKIIIGMSGVIFFLRISGKTQMAQLTPLDSVNAFVLGALIGGVIYNPDLSVWYICARNLDNRQYDYPLLAAFQSDQAFSQRRYGYDRQERTNQSQRIQT